MIKPREKAYLHQPIIFRLLFNPIFYFFFVKKISFDILYKRNYLLIAKIIDPSVSCVFNPTDVLTSPVSFAMIRHQ